MTNAQRFHELTGKDKNDVWNNFIGFRSSKFHCSCGLNFNYHNDLLEHIKESNPTYDNAADILNRMREFLEDDKYEEFIYTVGAYDKADHSIGLNEWISIDIEYILNPAALLERAIEFLEGK